MTSVSSTAYAILSTLLHLIIDSTISSGAAGRSDSIATSARPQNYHETRVLAGWHRVAFGVKGASSDTAEERFSLFLSFHHSINKGETTPAHSRRVWKTFWLLWTIYTTGDATTWAFG
jgi:hypothetical protein